MSDKPTIRELMDRPFTNEEEEAWVKEHGHRLFELANDPPKQNPWRAENNRAKQMALLSGLDCLPGQEDLFSDLDKRDP